MNIPYYSTLYRLPITEVSALEKNIQFLNIRGLLKKKIKTTNFPKQGIKTKIYTPTIFNMNIPFSSTLCSIPMTEVSASGRYIHILKYTRILKKDDENNKFP